MKEYQSLLKRAGIILEDFNIANPNKDHWAWPLAVLTSMVWLPEGFCDYLFDVRGYQEHLRR